INAMVRSSPALYRPTTARSRKFGARGGTHGFRRRDARKRGRAGGTGRPPLRRPRRGSVAAAAAAAEPGQEPAGLGLGARVAGHPLDPRPRPPALRTLEVPSDPVDDGHVSSPPPGVDCSTSARSQEFGTSGGDFVLAAAGVAAAGADHAFLAVRTVSRVSAVRTAPNHRAAVVDAPSTIRPPIRAPRAMARLNMTVLRAVTASAWSGAALKIHIWTPTG